MEASGALEDKCLGVTDMSEKREPLTLNQLRDMLESSEIVGVAVMVLDHGVECCGVLDEREDDGICVSTGACDEWLKEKDYGKTWVAFSYSDSHIKTEKWAGIWEGEADGYSDGQLVYDVWKCSGCGHVEETDDPDWLPSFCPNCGRAMTEEAMVVLERRLCGE